MYAYIYTYIYIYAYVYIEEKSWRICGKKPIKIRHAPIIIALCMTHLYRFLFIRLFP